MDFNNAMPEQTFKLFQKISNLNGLNDFVLVGGTALSIHLHHRLSEDLDFCATNGLELNRKEITRLLNSLEESGSTIVDIISTADEQEFLISGDDIREHHQKYLIDGVKVDFFIMENRAIRERLFNKGFKEIIPNIQIADINTLFHLKCLAVTQRTKSRDFFDIRTLMNEYDYSIEEVIQSIIEESELRISEDSVLNRFTPKTFPVSDEGLEGLVEDSQFQQKSLIDFFKQEVEAYKYEQINSLMPR